jgi:sterol desaturase/sphingolipid hydroxylase (fatty acid hydroxylase superfamily)
MFYFYVGTAVLFAFLITLELVIDWRKQLHLFDWKDSLVSLSFGILGVVTRVIFKFVFVKAFYDWLYGFRVFDLGDGSVFATQNLPQGGSETIFQWSALGLWVACFFANDFIYYWFHRWSHEYRFLWATHVNHHSSEFMNFTTAARTPFMNAIHHTLFWMPMPLLGFPTEMTLIIESIGFLFAFTQHTEIIPKLGPIEWFITTPSHHRVHHGSNARYIDKNYGNVLIIFDRMFGTFEPETEKVVYGITKNIKTYNPVRVALHEWFSIFFDMRKAADLRLKLNYLFGRVGWTPESDEPDAPNQHALK